MDKKIEIKDFSVDNIYNTNGRKCELFLAVILTFMVTSLVFLNTSPVIHSTTGSIVYKAVGYSFNIHFDADENKTQSFLDSTTMTILDRDPPDYIPNLGSPCFYEKTGLRFYKNSQAVPRQGFELRCLPRVFLAGFSKSGTTDLHYQITRHQHVYGSFYKESHFWNQHARTREGKKLTLRHYSGLFSHSTSLIDSCCLSHLFNHESHVHCAVNRKLSSDMMDHLLARKQQAARRRSKHLRKEIKQGIAKHGFGDPDEAIMNSTYCPITIMESTPRYIWDAHYWQDDPSNENSDVPVFLTPHKIKHTIPQAKVIVTMRRPEDRLWSDYHFYNKKLANIKNADHFHECVVQGIQWWNTCLKVYSMENCAYGLEYQDIPNPRQGETWDKGGAERLRISIYYIYVKTWLEVFRKDDVLFIRFEDYITDPLSYVNVHVYPFLGLPEISDYGLDLMTDALNEKPHLSNSKTKKLSMHQKTRKLLQDFYRPYNRMLADMLEDDRFLWEDR